MKILLFQPYWPTISLPYPRHLRLTLTRSFSNVMQVDLCSPVQIAKISSQNSPRLAAFSNSQWSQLDGCGFIIPRNPFSFNRRIGSTRRLLPFLFCRENLFSAFSQTSICRRMITPVNICINPSFFDHGVSFFSLKAPSPSLAACIPIFFIRLDVTFFSLAAPVSVSVAFSADSIAGDEITKVTDSIAKSAFCPFDAYYRKNLLYWLHHQQFLLPLRLFQEKWT